MRDLLVMGVLGAFLITTVEIIGWLFEREAPNPRPALPTDRSGPPPSRHDAGVELTHEELAAWRMLTDVHQQAEAIVASEATVSTGGRLGDPPAGGHRHAPQPTTHARAPHVIQCGTCGRSCPPPELPTVSGRDIVAWTHRECPGGSG